MAKAKEANASSLLSALNFSKVAFLEEGEAYQQHIILHNKMLYAYNGTIATGTPIEEEITACPQGHALRIALGRCKGAFSLTVDGERLAIKSGPFKASLPCLDLGALRPFQPDPGRVAIGEGLRPALAALSPLVADAGATVLESALALASGHASASNRLVIGQYWHGYELPGQFLLPKVAVDAVRNAPNTLVSFGHSANSVTFHFDNHSWIKSQLLYDDNYPDLEPFFRHPLQLTNLAEGFNEAVAALSPFDKDDKAMLYGPNGLEYRDGKLASSIDLEGIKGEVAFLAYNWQLLGKQVKLVDWLSDAKAVHFQGERFRGLMQKMAIMPIYKGTTNERYDDTNIPF